MNYQTVHRQFGSKVRTASEIIGLIPPGKAIWCEVFCGTAAVTLSKPPHKGEHLNDMNGNVVNLFEVMRDPAGLDRLCELVTLTPWSQAVQAQCWDVALVDLEPVDRAWAFLVRSWQTVGGKQTAGNWRLQKNNSWCYGTWNRVPKRLRETAIRLKGCYIHQRDCMDMVGMLDRDDAVLFIDPPYPYESLNTSGLIYEIDMTAEQHEAFARRVATCDASIILTMNPGTIYGDILADWYTTNLRVRGQRNSVKNEVIYTNFDPVMNDGLFATANQRSE